MAEARRRGVSVAVGGARRGEIDERENFWSEALDQLAEAVFRGDEGRGRAAPLLAQIDAHVGALGLGDQPHDLLQAMRIDAALCDLPIAGGGPGETWAWRAASGVIAGIEPSPVIRALAGSLAGIFEVSEVRGVMVLRDRLSGALAHVAAEERRWAIDGEVGLWDARLVLRRSGARLCRRPLAYPVEILGWLERASEQRWAGRAAPDLMAMRAMWLRWRRGRGGPEGFFRGFGG